MPMVKIIGKKLHLSVLRIKPLTVFLFLLFFCVCILCSFVFRNIAARDTLNKISRGYYGDSKITFSVSDSSGSAIGPVEVAKLFKNTCPDAELNHDSSDGMTRQICINGQAAVPPMLSGRYFTAEDFTKVKPYAVVGKTKALSEIHKDGKYYIDINGVQFEVIGVIGVKTATQLDNMVFINMDIPVTIESERLYTLDAKGKNANDLYKILAAAAEKRGISLKQIDTESQGIERILPQVNTQTILLASILSFALAILILSLEWINGQSKSIAVKRLLGRSTFELTRDVLKSYLSISILAAVFGTIVLLLLRNYDLASLFFSLIGTILCSLLVIIPSIIKMLKIPVSEALK